MSDKALHMCIVYVCECESECIWIKEGFFALMHPCLSGCFSSTCPCYMTAACSWHHLQACGN